MSSSGGHKSSNGRGGGGRGGGKRGGNRRNNNGGGGGGGGRRSSKNGLVTRQAEEDVLIEFMPYIRNQNPDALRIHQAHAGDERAFMQAASEFLQKERESLVAQVEKLSVDGDPVVLPQEKTKKISPIQRSPPRSPLPPSTSPLPPMFHAAPPGLPSFLSPQPSTPQQQHSLTPVSPGLPPGIPVRPMTAQHNNGGVGSSSMSPLPPSLEPQSLLKPVSPGPRSPVPAGNRLQPVTPGFSPISTPSKPPVETPVKRPAYQPKRIWTRIDQQPGRLFANDRPVNSPALNLRPRQELTAKWILPLKYLRQRQMTSSSDSTSSTMTMRDALESLTVGLFRRGCTENGSNASIISKQILAEPNESRKDYPFQVDPRTDAIFGTVPFYAPRTPGNVLFRLYWQEEPLYTLATGPTLFVRGTEEDFEPTLRFILSNFKSKKGSATSLSSLNALWTAVEQFRPVKRREGWEGAGRAAWGCVCESRKVLEVCATDYKKQKEKLRKLEIEVEQLKLEVDQEKQAAEEGEGEGSITNGHLSDDDCGGEESRSTKLKEKTGLLMGGRASSERKWKESQVSFANILKAILANPSSALLFRRELLAKIRLEYELYCSLIEAFAKSPFNSDCESLVVNFNEFPQHVSPSHMEKAKTSRQKMQQEALGFVPNTQSLQQTLFKANQPNVMDRNAVETFNGLSAAMGKLYEEVYMVSDRVLQQREMVRSHLETIVAQCDAFVPGTRVMIFGSSANGFGSPTSDLDMCLQMPPNSKRPNEDTDPTGAVAMGKLAELLERAGMIDVDAARLTARIPIIMFNCKRPMAQAGEDPTMECDLSFLNPLAVLNTSLLLSYSRIHPVTRVLAAVIKRWAKARDINNPSRHTLSSYGYIIMLLHFLTYQKRIGNGLVISINNKQVAHNNPASQAPLLPNLHWMGGNWLKSPPGTPYCELDALPPQYMAHPSEENTVVNTYFHGINDQQALQEIQSRFPSQDLSLSILLASFFRYYAFEFDYKRHVVSLHSTYKKGLTEREVKAETHGWKVYATGLAIEDPFETFYDVAHVVKGGNFYGLRNEFAKAYTKIVNSVSTGNVNSGKDLIDLICEPCDKENE